MEAAEIDGANAWQRFWNVTIPSISPIIFYNVLTALITHLRGYQSGTGAHRWWTGQKVHVYVLCHLSLCT
ncbi:MAG: ABC transporter permease subunit [Blautia massiliensis (ex Durand et al. 2017)]